MLRVCDQPGIETETSACYVLGNVVKITGNYHIVTSTVFGNQVVLVADEIAGRNIGPLKSRRDLEQSDHQTVQQLIAAMEATDCTVTYYQTPQELAENASKPVSYTHLTLPTIYSV